MERLQDYIDQREKYLTESAEKIEKGVKEIEADPSIVPEFKTKKIQEIKNSVSEEYSGRLGQNETEFISKIKGGIAEVTRLFDPDIHLEKLGEHEFSRATARYLREQNLFNRLSYLPDAESFISEYKRAIASEDEQALSFYEGLSKGIAGKFGEDAHKVLRVFEETRDERIPAYAVERKDLLAKMDMEFRHLNESAKNGLPGLRARAGAKAMLKDKFPKG